MSYQALVPVLKQVGPKVDDFDAAVRSLADIRSLEKCISAHLEPDGDAFRAVALLQASDAILAVYIASEPLPEGLSIAYMHPEEIAFKKAGPALQENLREVRDWLAEGDCDPSFSDPIDEALNMIEPHMEKFQK